MKKLFPLLEFHFFHNVSRFLEYIMEELIPSHFDPFRSIIIFGPPGSGKGTIGKFLSSAGHHCHLSSGDIFRGLAHDSPAGKIYHSYASKGLLVPDETTVQVCRHYIEGLIATNRYFPKKQLLLLDGIPRTLKQAELFESVIQVKQIIVLEMHNIDNLLVRMRKRAIIEGRQDDFDEKVLRTRMEVYDKETAQVLKHYPENLISRFNADQRPLEVLRDILNALCPLLITH